MRILLVEEDRLLLQPLKNGLENAGFAVDVAPECPDGSDLTKTGDYDVAILDFMLPGANGPSRLERWRGKRLAAHVLVLTAHTGTDEGLKLHLGADECITKPFLLEELLARLRALPHCGPEISTERILRVDDLEVDTRTRAVMRGGRPIRLTRREYALLEILARHRGKVVTRAKIQEHLYSQNGGKPSNVVDVYIRHLRQKIDGAGSAPLIHTRRSQGYFLRGK